MARAVVQWQMTVIVIHGQRGGVKPKNPNWKGRISRSWKGGKILKILERLFTNDVVRRRTEGFNPTATGFRVVPTPIDRSEGWR